MKRILLVAGLIGVLLVVAAGGWAAWTMRSAEQHLQAAREHLLDVRSAIASYDAEAATAAVALAQVESSAAADLAGRPVWSAAAALPRVGDTPHAARSLVLAADAATTAVSGVADAAGSLTAGDLFADGQVDVDAVAAAGAAAAGAQASLDVAMGHLAEMPSASSGAWVLAPVEDARAELTTQVQELASATRCWRRSARCCQTCWAPTGRRSTSWPSRRPTRRGALAGSSGHGPCCGPRTAGSRWPTSAPTGTSPTSTRCPSRWARSTCCATARTRGFSST